MSEVNKNLLRMRPEVNIEFRIYREWFEANILNISVLNEIFGDVLSVPALDRALQRPPTHVLPDRQTKPIFSVIGQLSRESSAGNAPFMLHRTARLTFQSEDFVARMAASTARPSALGPRAGEEGLRVERDLFLQTCPSRRLSTSRSV